MNKVYKKTGFLFLSLFLSLGFCIEKDFHNLFWFSIATKLILNFSLLFLSTCMIQFLWLPYIVIIKAYKTILEDISSLTCILVFHKIQKLLRIFEGNSSVTSA